MHQQNRFDVPKYQWEIVHLHRLAIDKFVNTMLGILPFSNNDQVTEFTKSKRALLLEYTQLQCVLAHENLISFFARSARDYIKSHSGIQIAR